MFSFGHYPNPPPFFLAMSRDPSYWVLCNVHFTMSPPCIGLYIVFLLRMHRAFVPPCIAIGLHFVFSLRIDCAFCRTIGPCSTHCTSLTNFSPLSCHFDDQKSLTGLAEIPFISEFTYFSKVALYTF